MAESVKVDKVPLAAATPDLCFGAAYVHVVVYDG